MNYFDVMIALPSGLVRSYLDFLLSFDYPLRVIIPVSTLRHASHPHIQTVCNYYTIIYTMLLLRSLKDNYKKITLSGIVVLMV